MPFDDFLHSRCSRVVYHSRPEPSKGGTVRRTTRKEMGGRATSTTVFLLFSQISYQKQCNQLHHVCVVNVATIDPAGGSNNVVTSSQIRPVVIDNQHPESITSRHRWCLLVAQRESVVLWRQQFQQKTRRVQGLGYPRMVNRCQVLAVIMTCFLRLPRRQIEAFTPIVGGLAPVPLAALTAASTTTATVLAAGRVQSAPTGVA